MNYIPNAMKLDTQSKSIWLILNMYLKIVDLDPELIFWANLVQTLRFALIFMKFGTHNKL